MPIKQTIFLFKGLSNTVDTINNVENNVLNVTEPYRGINNTSRLLLLVVSFFIILSSIFLTENNLSSDLYFVSNIELYFIFMLIKLIIITFNFIVILGLNGIQNLILIIIKTIYYLLLVIFILYTIFSIFIFISRFSGEMNIGLMNKYNIIRKILKFGFNGLISFAIIILFNINNISNINIIYYILIPIFTILLTYIFSALYSNNVFKTPNYKINVNY